MYSCIYYELQSHIHLNFNKRITGIDQIILNHCLANILALLVGRATGIVDVPNLGDAVRLWTLFAVVPVLAPLFLGFLSPLEFVWILLLFFRFPLQPIASFNFAFLSSSNFAAMFFSFIFTFIWKWIKGKSATNSVRRRWTMEMNKGNLATLSVWSTWPKLPKQHKAAIFK